VVWPSFSNIDIDIVLFLQHRDIVLFLQHHMSRLYVAVGTVLNELCVTSTVLWHMHVHR
jgi:hypothetical protein